MTNSLKGLLASVSKRAYQIYATIKQFLLRIEWVILGKKAAKVALVVLIALILVRMVVGGGVPSSFAPPQPPQPAIEMVLAAPTQEVAPPASVSAVASYKANFEVDLTAIKRQVQDTVNNAGERSRCDVATSMRNANVTANGARINVDFDLSVTKHKCAKGGIFGKKGFHWAQSTSEGHIIVEARPVVGPNNEVLIETNVVKNSMGKIFWVKNINNLVKHKIETVIQAKLAALPKMSIPATADISDVQFVNLDGGGLGMTFKLTGTASPSV